MAAKVEQTLVAMATQINYNFTQTRPRVPIAAMFSGPGPGVYLLRGTTGFKLHDSTKRMNPAFSMGSRPRVITYSFTPGPAAYPIEKGLTRHGADGTAKYSLKGRTQMGQQYNNPAPCKYMLLFELLEPPLVSYKIENSCLT